MKMGAKSIILLAVYAMLSTAPALVAQNATASGQFSLQGKLTAEASNQPIADGQHELLVSIYNNTSGEVVFSETDIVTTVDGVFSTMIGDDSELSLEGNADYEIGIAVDGEAELMPRLEVGDAPGAIRAELASNAEAVGGFTVSSDGEANSIIVTDGEGKIGASVMSKSIEVTGNGVAVDTTGGKLSLNVDASAGTNVPLPYSDTVNVGAGDVGFELSAMGSGSASSFVNLGTGSAINLSANSGANSALNVENSAGVAINAEGTSDGQAIIHIQNGSASANAGLLLGLDASGETRFKVDADGSTEIHASVPNALEVSTDVDGGTALKVNGGIELGSAIGVGTIPAGSTDVTINNSLVSESSIIFTTVNSATSVANGIRVASKSNGSFTVSLLNTTLGSLSGDLEFHYLIVNQAEL